MSRMLLGTNRLVKQGRIRRSVQANSGSVANPRLHNAAAYNGPSGRRGTYLAHFGTDFARGCVESFAIPKDKPRLLPAPVLQAQTIFVVINPDSGEPVGNPQA